MVNISRYFKEGVGNNVINTHHRRDTSLKLDGLREKTKAFFGHSGDNEIFIEKINSLYPRYVRDQLTTGVITTATRCQQWLIHAVSSWQLSIS